MNELKPLWDFISNNFISLGALTVSIYVFVQNKRYMKEGKISQRKVDEIISDLNEFLELINKIDLQAKENIDITSLSKESTSLLSKLSGLTNKSYIFFDSFKNKKIIELHSDIMLLIGIWESSLIKKDIDNQVFSLLTRKIILLKNTIYEEFIQ